MTEHPLQIARAPSVALGRRFAVIISHPGRFSLEAQRILIGGIRHGFGFALEFLKGRVPGKISKQIWMGGSFLVWRDGTSVTLDQVRSMKEPKPEPKPDEVRAYELCEWLDNLMETEHEPLRDLPAFAPLLRRLADVLECDEQPAFLHAVLEDEIADDDEEHAQNESENDDD